MSRGFQNAIAGLMLVLSLILFGDIARSVVHVRSPHHAGYRIAGNPVFHVTEFLGAVACLVVALKTHRTAGPNVLPRLGRDR